jgi:predicted  nucleic acid-binding Zn-ribbon protein
MARQAQVLKRIVALKRQSAEQRVRALQIEAEGIEAEIAGIMRDLATLDEVTAGIEAHLLAEQHGHVRKLIDNRRAAEVRLLAKRQEVRAAHDALKRAFHSEERLNAAAAKS